MVVMEIKNNLYFFSCILNFGRNNKSCFESCFATDKMKKFILIIFLILMCENSKVEAYTCNWACESGYYTLVQDCDCSFLDNPCDISYYIELYGDYLQNNIWFSINDVTGCNPYLFRSVGTELFTVYWPPPSTGYYEFAYVDFAEWACVCEWITRPRSENFCIAKHTDYVGTTICVGEIFSVSYIEYCYEDPILCWQYQSGSQNSGVGKKQKGSKAKYNGKRYKGINGKEIRN